MRDVNENELQVHGVEVEDERNIFDVPRIHDAPWNENIQTRIDEPIVEGHVFPRYDKVSSCIA